MVQTSPRLWTARTWPFIVSTLVLMTSIAFETFAITTILPVAMADLDAVQWYSLAFSATLTAGLVGMVVGGNWSDRSGPRRPLMLGGALFLLGLVLCIVAPNAAVFIAGRFLQGLGGGIDSVVLYVLIARKIPDGARPKMFGLFTTAWLLPSIAEPLLAGTLTELTTWRTVFVLILAGSGVALAGLLRTTRTVPRLAGQRAGVAEIIGRQATLALAQEDEQGTYSSGLQAGESMAVAATTAVMAAILATTSAGFVLVYAVLALGGLATILIAARAPVVRSVAAA